MLLEVRRSSSPDGGRDSSGRKEMAEDGRRVAGDGGERQRRRGDAIGDDGAARWLRGGAAAGDVGRWRRGGAAEAASWAAEASGFGRGRAAGGDRASGAHDGPSGAAAKWA